MSNALEVAVDRDRSNIAVVRNGWIEAVKAGNADRLADLVTSDVVVVHLDGGCTHGKDEVKRFFQDGFDQYDVKGTISSSDVVIHGLWAVEIDQMESTRTQYSSAMSVNTPLQAVFVFNRQVDHSWKVARIIELEEPR